jgi:hypothetical protein
MFLILYENGYENKLVIVVGIARASSNMSLCLYTA